MVVLGQIAKAVRLQKGYTLAGVCDLIEDLGAGKVDPSHLKKMEDGTRPGEPRVWGAIWTGLSLPLRQLYEGLGLPVPESEPTGHVAEAVTLLRGMPEDAQGVALYLIKHAPALRAIARGPLSLDAPGRVALRAAEAREGYSTTQEGEGDGATTKARGPRVLRENRQRP